MSNEITRMFASHADAKSAAADLAEAGFDDVHIVAPPAGDVPLSAIAAQIAQGRVLLADARIYAKGVAAGGTLLTVHAPFGSGMEATSIMEAYNTIPSGMPEAAPGRMWDEATPLSSAFALDVLLSDPTPASRVIGVAPLASSDCSFSGSIGMPLLSSNPAPLSSLVGMSTLSRNATPLSSLIGFPTLTRSKGVMW